jgi:hypothetical protein
MMSYWKRVDERLIKRGMLIMDLDFLRNYQDELIRMNRKKRGRPYRMAESYVRFLAVIRKERDRTYYKAKEECQDDKILRIQTLEQNGKRWMAEAAISRFKALFGEHLLSRKPRWMDSELTIKAFIYNMLLRALTT